jgi:hypothetical protein
MKKGQAAARKRKSRSGWTRGEGSLWARRRESHDKILKFPNCFSFSLVWFRL